MREFANKGAFITGGGAGFGLALARELHGRGMRVAIADIRREVLDEAVATFPADEESRSRIVPFVVDVADRVRMAEVADAAEQALGGIHLLCNNAGVGVAGPIKDATFDDWDWMHGVMVDGVFNGVRLFLPKLRAQGGGHILNTASMSGAFVSGNAGVYTATKFAVVGMTEALRAELAPEGIGVSVFLAGPMQTKLMWSHKLRPAGVVTGFAQHDREREVFAKKYDEQMANGTCAGMTTEEAARRVVRGIERDDLYIITHAEFEPGLRARAEAIQRAIPREPARPSVYAPLLLNEIYTGQTEVPPFTPEE